MKRMKRILTILLIFIFLLSTFINPVFAAKKPNPTPSGSIYYVALGDSIATGTTGLGSTNSYVKSFYSYLLTLNSSAIMKNLSSDGDKSYDLLNKLKNDRAFKREVSKATIITISIGGNNIMNAANDDFSIINDTMAESGTKAFINEYPQIIETIRALNSKAKIISSTLYNPYSAIPIGRFTDDPELRLQAERYIAQGIYAIEPNSINEAINSVSSPNYYVVDVHGRFSEYAGDVVYGKTMDDITNFFNEFIFLFGFRDPHPNQTGQNIISQLHIDKFKLIN